MRVLPKRGLPAFIRQIPTAIQRSRLMTFISVLGAILTLLITLVSYSLGGKEWFCGSKSLGACWRAPVPFVQLDPAFCEFYLSRAALLRNLDVRQTYMTTGRRGSEVVDALLQHQRIAVAYDTALAMPDYAEERRLRARLLESAHLLAVLDHPLARELLVEAERALGCRFQSSLRTVGGD